VEQNALSKRQDADAAHNERARRETLRRDAARPLGENLEQTDVLIKTAFALAQGFVERPR
jgi:hypothetical protein